MAKLADAHALGACWDNSQCRFNSCLRQIYLLTFYKIMYKKLVSPFQKVLLEKRMCVGCTNPLDKAKRIGKISERREMVECKCKRRYIFNKELNEYQRASFQEEQQFLKELSKKALV